MLQNDMQYLLKSFSKTTRLSIRLHQDGKQIYYYSHAGLVPDPAGAVLDTIISFPHQAGVITTSLFQHYGYVRLPANQLLIIGPTAAFSENQQEFENLTFLLDVDSAQAEEYLYALCCAPEIPAQHIAWMLSFFVTALKGKAFDVENVYIDTKNRELKEPIAHDHTQEIFNSLEDQDLSEMVLSSYRFEGLANLYVRNGQPEHLIELFDSVPPIQAGKMAGDTLRQYKNMLICSATTMSRAAIEGGLDPQSAFKLSDLYIQKGEVMRNPTSVMALIREMAGDMAERVRSKNNGNVKDSKLFNSCTTYINKHLFSRIDTATMAEELGLSRSYLSKEFHAQTGKTLSEFILEQKITEAKKLLRYTNKSISNIAMHLAFSSQSHFQNTFKKCVGMTPLEYKKLPTTL